MAEDFKVINGYRHNEALRKSFNELAMKTYGIDFENWYKYGYWTEKYNPYSIVVDDKVVANVSVNKMEFEVNGKSESYLQLGTVMTDEKYRNRGFIKTIMNEIDREYCELVEGIYLFANDTVLEFYTKFGFEKGIEYQYSKDVRNSVNEIKVQGFKIDTKENRSIIEKAITNSVVNSAFEMINNKELIMFYLTQFMGDNIYFFEEERAYIIAEIDGDLLKLYNIFSDKKVEIDKIIEGFAGMIRKVILEFTPLNKEGYGALELIKENTTLFVKGKGFDSFEEKRLMFPELSHA